MEVSSMLDDPFFYRPDAEGNLKLCCEVKQRNHRNKSFQYVKNWGTCIDIGANVGHWSRDFTKKFKRVIAFEPQSIFIECYKKNIDMTKVELHQLGLSNQEELTSMDPVGQVMFQSTNNNIKCVTLDSMGFDFPIDYIKIDVDGYEYNVLRGARETLTNQKKCVINIELKRKNLKENYGPTIDLLNDYGFEHVDRHAGDSIFLKK